MSILLPTSQSLKDRRSELRRLKDLVRRKFPVSIAEVEIEDLWQLATLGFVTVSNDRAFVESVIERVLSLIDSEVKIMDEDRDILTYGEGPLSEEDYPHWEPGIPSPPAAARPTKPGRTLARQIRPPAKAESNLPFPWEQATTAPASPHNDLDGADDPDDSNAYQEGDLDAAGQEASLDRDRGPAKT